MLIVVLILASFHNETHKTMRTPIKQQLEIVAFTLAVTSSAVVFALALLL